MRLTQKKVEEILTEIIGGEGLPLLKQLYGRENVSEFELASRTRKDIKLIRKMLYVLYNHNLVGFTRKKDKQKGWYIYYWTLLLEGVRFFYIKKKKELLQNLQQQAEQEQKELFFVCSSNCVRLNFDQATDFEFHCPECGQLTVQDEVKGKVELLTKEIAAVRAELRELTLPARGKKPKKKAATAKKNAARRKRC